MMRRIFLAFVVAVASVGVLTAVSTPAEAGSRDCFSYGYACTPGYTGDNASATWAWRYYGAPYSNTPNGTHNCTLYVAFRLAQAGMPNPGHSWGNATQWASAIGGGDHNPTVGSVAYYSAAAVGGVGHVAYVEQVNGSQVFIRADNYSTTAGYTDAGWVSASSVTLFLHPHDTGGGSSVTNGYETAFQANTGSMFNQGDLQNGDAKLGMAAGTSPGVAVLSNGGFESALQANTGNMWIYGNAGTGDTGQGMAAWTSPSIAASPTGGFEAAFQANNGFLYTYSSPGGPANRQLGMAPGTSPAIAALPGGGYEVAFQANTGNLWVYGDAGTVDTGQGMKSGTSPTIAASRNGGYEVAFQANTGNLYTYASSGGPANRQEGMDNLTSPAIAALSGGGYEIAFQANTGNLFVNSDGGGGDTGQGMKINTSPAVAASPAGGYEVVFQANTGEMYWYRSTTGPADLQLGMDNITSPCVSSALGGGCAPAAPASPSAIITTRLPSGVVGKPWSATLTAAGGSDPYAWSVAAGSLPLGLTLASNGRIAGTPRHATTATVTFRIADALGARWVTTKSLTFAVAPVAIRTTTLPTAYAKRTYSATLSAYGTGPMTWTISSGKLPKGITLSKSGHLGGKAAKAGKTTFTVKVTTANHATKTRKLTLTVR